MFQYPGAFPHLLVSYSHGASVEQARPRSTLTNLPRGWAAVAPGGRYKTDSDVVGELWHLVGMCRFELGELDGYPAEVQQVGLEAEL